MDKVTRGEILAVLGLLISISLWRGIWYAFGVIAGWTIGFTIVWIAWHLGVKRFLKLS